MEELKVVAVEPEKFEDIDSLLMLTPGEIEAIGHQRMSKDEEAEIIRRIRSGDEDVKEKFIANNMRLVSYIASSYRGLADVDDLFQEGMIGLLKAIDNFNLDIGVKFSTYATYWAKASMLRSIKNTSRQIRIPVGIEDLILRVNSIRQTILAETGEDPDIKTVARLANLTVERVQDLDKYSLTCSNISINQDVGIQGNGQNDDYSLLDTLEDETVNIEEDAARKMLVAQISEIVEGFLSEKEKVILYQRFGFFGRPRTLQEIADMIGITREGVRRRLNAIYKKLGKSKDMQRVADELLAYATENKINGEDFNCDGDIADEDFED